MRPDVNIVAVANGRYFGGSMKIAPAAMLNDSLFDLVISDDLRLKDFLKHHKKLYAGSTSRLMSFKSIAYQSDRFIAW